MPLRRFPSCAQTIVHAVTTASSNRSLLIPIFCFRHAYSCARIPYLYIGRSSGSPQSALPSRRLEASHSSESASVALYKQTLSAGDYSCRNSSGFAPDSLTSWRHLPPDCLNFDCKGTKFTNNYQRKVAKSYLIVRNRLASRCVSRKLATLLSHESRK